MLFLHPDDLYAAVDALPAPLKTVMENRGNRIFVAGGLLRAIIAREPINDVDVFTETVVDHRLLVNGISQVKVNISETHNAFTIKTDPTIQVIRPWTFDSPQECIDSFDFTICQAAIWFFGGSWHSVCSQNFYPDLAAKRLRYTCPVRKELDPLSSAVRMIKFNQRGYTITPAELAKVARAAVALADIEAIGSIPYPNKPIGIFTKVY